MDSGFLEPGETMEDEYDFSQSLLPEEIIGIIDQLLCHEVNILSYWEMGLTLYRWHGTWDIHFPKPFSLACISTGF